MRSRAREIERAIAELEAKLGTAPTDEQIAEKIGITVDELEDSLTDISRSSIAALDELWSVSGEGDQVSLMDTIEDTTGPRPAEVLDETEMREALAEAIARLPEREKLVVTLYYYEELTLREIGEVLGVDRVARLPAAHEGDPAPEGPARRRRPRESEQNRNLRLRLGLRRGPRLEA